jgi:molybdate transport system substrate-binding protein
MIRACITILLAAYIVTDANNKSNSIFVYCAGGMQKPIAALSKEFETQKGIRVDVTYHGTNTLLGQIKLSRKGDVYIAGDADYIEMARKDSLVAETKTLCWFIPVIMVKKGNPLKVQTLFDLTKPGIKLGQGDDKAAAVGRLMPKILAMNGVDTASWNKNLKLVTPTGNELGLAFKLGTLDATVVWGTIANYYLDVADQVLIPIDKNITPMVEAAVLKCSRDAKLAAQYLEFITSEYARKVLKDNGYVIDKPVK